MYELIGRLVVYGAIAFLVVAGVTIFWVGGEMLIASGGARICAPISGAC